MFKENLITVCKERFILHTNSYSGKIWHAMSAINPILTLFSDKLYWVLSTRNLEKQPQGFCPFVLHLQWWSVGLMNTVFFISPLSVRARRMSALWDKTLGWSKCWLKPVSRIGVIKLLTLIPVHRNLWCTKVKNKKKDIVRNSWKDSLMC